ncbi:hypothetical protein CJ030_MR5G010123 [Morella rubra]|uniref:Uncharacterized protein n=1 Tax=Morella rubra TaxID=262757 RepID=A0A6A1VJE9_9ROSI|nr:hypothetical protein CJ030_MR5G010123 [Morella rubra]
MSATLCSKAVSRPLISLTMSWVGRRPIASAQSAASSYRPSNPVAVPKSLGRALSRILLLHCLLRLLVSSNSSNPEAFSARRVWGNDFESVVLLIDPSGAPSARQHPRVPAWRAGTGSEEPVRQ